MILTSNHFTEVRYCFPPLYFILSTLHSPKILVYGSFENEQNVINIWIVTKLIGKVGICDMFCYLFRNQLSSVHSDGIPHFE